MNKAQQANVRQLDFTAKPVRRDPSKERWRRKLEADTEQYLAAGGQIQPIPYLHCTFPVYEHLSDKERGYIGVLDQLHTVPEKTYHCVIHTGDD